MKVSLSKSLKKTATAAAKEPKKAAGPGTRGKSDITVFVKNLPYDVSTPVLGL